MGTKGADELRTIAVTVEVPDEHLDPGHETGLTEAGYMALHKALSVAGFALDDVQPKR